MHAGRVGHIFIDNFNDPKGRELRGEGEWCADLSQHGIPRRRRVQCH